MSIEIVIAAEDDGVKPKNFLKKQIDIPFYKVVKLIKDKRIKLNGKKIKKETVLKEGDVLKIWSNDIVIKEEVRNHKDMKDLGLDVIFENEDFIVFNKLPGVVVQGAQHNDMSLGLHLAFYQEKIKASKDFEFFHVHRLDKDTSGCLVVAKKKIVLRDLNKVFREKNIVKKYLCLCVGEFDKKEGKIECIMRRNEDGSLEKMGIVSEREQGDKKSLSYYKVLEEFEFEDDVFSLVEVEIKTGVTHQIRVHMKSLGHPIVCDAMYGNSYINRKYVEDLGRQFLHAVHLEFGYKEENFSFEAPLIDDLKRFLKKIRGL